MSTAPHSGDYARINQLKDSHSDSDSDSDHDRGNDTGYEDRLVDHLTEQRTNDDLQSIGVLQPLRADRRQRRNSFIEEDGDALTLDVPPIEVQGEKDKPITWMSLVSLFSFWVFLWGEERYCRFRGNLQSLELERILMNTWLI